MTASRMSFPPLEPPSPCAGPYTLRARSARVARDWDSMAKRVPTAVQACYEHLATAPRRPIPRRVYPLRGRPFHGLWEYEVTGSERLFYLPDAQNEREMAGWQPEEGEKVCLVLACGGHIPAPRRP